MNCRLFLLRYSYLGGYTCLIPQVGIAQELGLKEVRRCRIRRVRLVKRGLFVDLMSTNFAEMVTAGRSGNVGVP